MCKCSCVVFIAVAFALLWKDTQSARVLPQSPCPEIFNYIERLHNEIFGAIKIENDRSGVYDIEVNMSIAIKTDQNIKIVRKTIEYRVYEGDSIEYYVIFPSNHTLPNLTSIKFNGHLYCVNPPDDGAKTTLLSSKHSFKIKQSIGQIQMKINSKYTNGECGISTLSTDYEPSEDRWTKEGEYPWLVPIFQFKDRDYMYICAGTLITNIHVITAAHCVLFRRNITKESLVLVFERHSIKNWVLHSTIKAASEILVHPDFTLSPKRDSDMAVIILDGPVNFGPLVRPICLWDEPDTLDGVIDQRGFFAGFGKKLTEPGGRYLDVPRKLTMSIVSQLTCIRSHDAFKNLTSPRTFCARGTNGITPCRGDSGGGYVMKRNEKWTLRGIVTSSLVDYNTKDCDGNNYVVFQDIPKYNSWLALIFSQSNY